jgi:Ca2+-binding EF-hand superfamily protein
MYDAADSASNADEDWQSRLERFDWGEIQRMSPEERRQRMEAMRAEWEARMDKNGDGVVDEDERLDAVLASPMGRRLLDRFDADGDGMLDESERAALRAEEARRQAEREQRILDRYDADGGEPPPPRGTPPADGTADA